jgi:cytochrome c-type biogenesis protein CcmE
MFMKGASMQLPQTKFILIGGGVILSMALLVVVGTQGSGVGYYMTVAEFMDAPGDIRAGLRVNGKVVHGTIERHDTGEDVDFSMTDGQATLAVYYRGIIPDTFVDGADVVVEGQLQTDGIFAAHTLLAKCPSKYESADTYPDVPPADAPVELTSSD